MIVLEYIEPVLFALCTFSVAYLLFYAIAATSRHTERYTESHSKHRFAILIPAYRDDEYIRYAVQSFLDQEYPIDCFSVIVISDQLKPETDAMLARFPIILLKAKFKKSSKMKSIKAAMSQLQEGQYDVVLIANADNVVEKNFLNDLNNAYANGSNAIQTHRIRNERPNNLIVLDAVTDEINNTIFRTGHVAIGLSSSLNGSGAAFNFSWFKEKVRQLDDEDDERAVESMLLQDRMYIEYLHNTIVYASRSGSKNRFYQQHRIWISTQYASLFTNIRKLPGAILSGNMDYADRILQWCILPRTILIAIIHLSGLCSLMYDWSTSVKWWILLLIYLFTLSLATPDYLVDKNFNKAMKRIPLIGIDMFFNIFFKPHKLKAK